MTEIKDLRKTFEKGDVTVIVEWHEDENVDISHYGKYTDEDGDYVVDRQTGELVGEYLPELDVEDFLPDKPSDEITDDEWDEADRKADVACDEWVEAPRQVLADGLSTMSRNEYQYFIPERLRDFPEGWKHVSGEDVEGYWKEAERKFKRYNIDTGDKKLDLSVLQACQDYERVERLSRGDWGYMGCIVQAESTPMGGIGYSSVWGVESDASEYIEEVERSIVAEALEKIGLSEMLEEVVEELEN